MAWTMPDRQMRGFDHDLKLLQISTCTVDSVELPYMCITSVVNTGLQFEPQIHPGDLSVERFWCSLTMRWFAFGVPVLTVLYPDH